MLKTVFGIIGFFFQTQFWDKYFWLDKKYLKERKRYSICHIYQLFKER